MLKIIIAIFSLACINGCTAQPSTIDVTINNVTYTAEEAITDAEKWTGLMHREKLGEYQAMMFFYEEEAPRAFWMKNTLIPLDIIYMDANYNIISIAKEAQPCKTIKCQSYPSTGPAQYILEINGGQSDLHNFQIGDHADITSP